jgi:hypothetical protein
MLDYLVRAFFSEFLIRVAAVKVETDGKQEAYLVPDGVLHPKYSHRTTGFAKYILCRKSVVPLLMKRGLHRRILMGKEVKLHGRLAEQISWQLRERVIQVSGLCW